MDNEKLNIYCGREKTFKNELKNLQEDSISDRNKELIHSFRNYLFSTTAKEIRVSKLSMQLRKICLMLQNLKVNKNLDNLGKTDLINLVSFINQMDRKDLTKADYRVCLKQFYKWFKEEDLRLNDKDSEAHKFYNYLEKEVRRKCKKLEIDPSTIITEEDISLILDKGCTNPRDKAFISLLHETGMRASEFLNLRIKDIVFEKEIARLQVPDGKTGMRRILIYRSIPYLQRYLEIHKIKDNQVYLASL